MLVVCFHRAEVISEEEYEDVVLSAKLLSTCISVEFINRHPQLRAECVAKGFLELKSQI
jgi:hypothetical protein